MATAHTFDRHEKQQRIERTQRREIRSILSLIIHHAAEPDTEPRPFVCLRCHHTHELCTCKEVTL